MNAKKFLIETYNVTPQLIDFCEKVLEGLAPQFQHIDETAEYSQLKVLAAMQKNRLSEGHFAPTSGYGYNDIGREALEAIYADTFGAEAALVRPQMISGTHAIATALFGNLRPGDELLSAVGAPYDTLQGVIGIRAAAGSLAEHGVTYRQVELGPDGKPDLAAIKQTVSDKTKMVTIQRSKGYAWRRSFTVAEIGEIIAAAKSAKPDVVCMVDNCYGEFVETREPIEVGADLIAGSLIKSPGGGLAPVGGYIAGRAQLVENAAYRLTAPGLGKAAGPTLGLVKPMVQGFFFAPGVVAASLKAAVFAAALFESCGFDVNPTPREARADIVQAIRLQSAENLIAYCQGIQKAAPVDGFVTPEPGPMPGYDCPVIMASGAFNQGSTIEFSADGPMRPPYTAYMQGGLTWYHAKAGVILAVNNMLRQGKLSCPDIGV